MLLPPLGIYEILREISTPALCTSYNRYRTIIELHSRTIPLKRNVSIVFFLLCEFLHDIRVGAGAGRERDSHFSTKNEH